MRYTITEIRASNSDRLEAMLSGRFGKKKHFSTSECVLSVKEKLTAAVSEKFSCRVGQAPKVMTLGSFSLMAGYCDFLPKLEMSKDKMSKFKL
jgi:hypothetical protein